MDLGAALAELTPLCRRLLRSQQSQKMQHSLDLAAAGGVWNGDGNGDGRDAMVVLGVSSSAWCCPQASAATKKLAWSSNCSNLPVMRASEFK
mmetsp:Transcript_70619/g.197268  ORF Transcript_70619/g.197268 Transcript_70619/m.197268 type:complete len:92 (-) Transcript_70619:62-337(-)